MRYLNATFERGNGSLEVPFVYMDKAESKARDRLSRGSGPLGELAGFLRQSDGFGELPALDKARGEPPA